MNILIVDNEKTILKMLKKQLEKVAVNIKTVDNYEEAKKEILQNNFDVILLDHQLSKNGSEKNGLDLVKEVRLKRNKTPILILTAREIDEINSWETLDSGADDFIKKPYVLDDLIARIRLAYRKSFQCTNNATNNVVHNAIELDISARKVQVRGKETILGEKEILLLAKFLQYPYKLFSSADLINYLWGNTSLDDKKNLNALRVYICSLKNIIADDKYIHNRYGYGYIFDESEEKVI